MTGTVIDVQVFTREGIVRDKRAQSIIDDELRRYRQDLNDQLRIVENDQFDRIEKLLVGKTVNGGPRKLAKGATITKAYLADLDRWQWFDIRLADEPHAVVLEQAKESLEQKRHQFDLAFEEKRKKLTQGDELPRRAQDDQGLPGREAPPAAWRQDGRPSRQQGRGLAHHPGRGHAAHG